MRLDECLSAVKKMIQKISSLFDGFKSIGPIVILAITSFFAIWVKGVSDQKKRNALNEIDNMAE